MKISYAITVSSEVQEYERLLNFLGPRKSGEDEIVVLIDRGKASTSISELEVTKMYVDVVAEEVFQNDFAAWKNRLDSFCTGDWIFQLDADELPSEQLVQNLHSILESTEAEVIAVPRSNRVEGITDEDIARWGWRVSEEGINWPDYQFRLYENKPSIQWVGKVHERPIGYLKYAIIPHSQVMYKLDHYKDIKRQRQQNAFYSTLISNG